MGVYLNKTRVCIQTALTSRWSLLWWVLLHVTRAVGSGQPNVKRQQ